MVPRQYSHISLGRLFDPFGLPSKYFFKFVHPNRFEYVVSLHILQGSFFFSSGLYPLFLPEPLSLWLPLFLALPLDSSSLAFVALLLAYGELDQS